MYARAVLIRFVQKSGIVEQKTLIVPCMRKAQSGIGECKLKKPYKYSQGARSHT